MDTLNHIRKPERRTSAAKAIFHTAMFLISGLSTGVIIKLFDIYTANLGNIFSQISVWFFLCTILAVYSSTAKRAAVNVFSFCSGMLLTYYITAELTASVYSLTFVYGRTLFDLFSLAMGFTAWYAKGKSLISKIISIGIVIVMLAASSALFDKIRLSDIVFAVLTGFILLKNKDIEKMKESGVLE